MTLDDALNLWSCNTKLQAELKESRLYGVEYLHYVNGELKNFDYIYQDGDDVDIYPCYTASGWFSNFLGKALNVFTFGLAGAVCRYIGRLMVQGLDENYRNRTQKQETRNDSYNNNDAFSKALANIKAEGQFWRLLYGELMTGTLKVSQTLTTHTFLAPSQEQRNLLTEAELKNFSSSDGNDSTSNNAINVLEVTEAVRVVEDEQRRERERLQQAIRTQYLNALSSVNINYNYYKSQLEAVYTPSLEADLFNTNVFNSFKPKFDEIVNRARAEKEAYDREQERIRNELRAEIDDARTGR